MLLRQADRLRTAAGCQHLEAIGLQGDPGDRANRVLVLDEEQRFRCSTGLLRDTPAPARCVDSGAAGSRIRNIVPTPTSV